MAALSLHRPQRMLRAFNYECQHSALHGHDETADEHSSCTIPAVDAYVTGLEADLGCAPGWFDAPATRSG